MKILISAIDNPYIRPIGGKHIHQLLLERGLKVLGKDVTALYPVRYFKVRYIIYALSFLLKKPSYWRFRKDIEFIINELRRKYIRKYRNRIFDVVHFHDVVSAVALNDIVHSKVRILTLHGYFAKEVLNYGHHEGIERKRVYEYSKRIEKKSLENIDHIITVDARLKRYAMEELNVPEKMITVIQNAVDTETFSPVSEEEKSNFRKRLEISLDSFVLLIPRRLVKKNGVIYAIKAMKEISYPDIEMIIIGNGPERKRIMNEINNDRRIRMLGSIFHNKIVPYYEASDVIVIPSIRSDDIEEATSLSMLEGMACGKPVICSNIGGMKEVIEDGVNGFLVEQKSPDEIAGIIMNIYKDRSIIEKIGKMAREYVIKNHSYISHSNKMLQIYLKYLKNARRIET